MTKLLAHFVARIDRQEAMLEALLQTGRRWAAAGAQGVLWRAREKDPLCCRGDGRRLPRAFDASLECRWTGDATPPEPELRALGEAVADLVHPDLCAALVGRDRVFVACEATPVRYQYCMRRRPEWSHDDYLQRYAEGHSPLGVRTQGKLGYLQFHVDPLASARAGAAAGFGVRNVDSVAQLELESLEAFLAAGAENAKLGAAEDEDQFVDRAASQMWVSDRVERFGAPEGRP